MKKRPIWCALTESETGLDKLPVGALIQIENYATLGVAQFSVKTKTGVLTTTTLAQAITAGNLVNRELSDADRTKLNGIAVNANNYTLPNSSSTVAGGLKSRVSGSILYLTNNGGNA